ENVSDSEPGQENQSLLHCPAPLRSLPSLSPALRDTDPAIGWDQRTGTVSCLTSLYRVVARRVRSWPDGYDRGLRVRPGGGGGRSPAERPAACAQRTPGGCWAVPCTPPPRAASSRASTPTTFRPGYTRSSTAAASASMGSSKVHAMTPPLVTR